MKKTSNNKRIQGNNSGFSVIKVVFGIFVAVVVITVSTVAFYEGRKAYWDYKVQKMCDKEGGVFIIDRVKITEDHKKNMGTVGGYISIPLKPSANEDYPVYYIYDEEVIRQSNPRVTKVEEKVYRSKGDKVVAVVVRFKRSGGDFPSHAHASSFSCPKNENIYSDREKIFIVQGG